MTHALLNPAMQHGVSKDAQARAPIVSIQTPSKTEHSRGEQPPTATGLRVSFRVLWHAQRAFLSCTNARA
jgi:hypothetical protein